MKNGEPRSNRKIRYTKMVLRDSLIELMKEKPILKITIKDICELADVSRSTFYAHYNDQFDLLQSIQEETTSYLEELLDKYDGLEGKNVTTKITEEILKYIADNSNSIQVLMSENGDVNFQKKLFAYNRQKKVLSFFKNIDNVKIQEYTTIYAVSGTISLIQQWLKNNMDLPVNEVAKLITKLAQN